MPEGLTVSELCQRIDAAVSDAFPAEIWVNGAISGISRSANGHVYFDLVEPDDPDNPGDRGAPPATLPVALFVKSKHRVNAILKRTNAIRMTDGVEVQVRGEVKYYPRQSRVQLIMTLIDPAYTLGQLESSKALLLTQLKAEGLLVKNKRHRIPVLPLRIALLTSRGSAAEADFVDELERSAYDFDITVFDTRVQGDEAVPGLCRALHELNEERHQDFDVIVVVRGGGARTDLVAFDNGDVARAIANSVLPVIVGVGHETDQSVADEVAHTSAKTPTASARVLIDTVQHFERRVNACSDRIAHRSNDVLRQADLILAAYQARIGRSGMESVTRSELQLARLGERTATSAALAVERTEAALERFELRIRAVDPAEVMARGWSITRVLQSDGTLKGHSTGALVRSTQDVAPGVILQTTLMDGTVLSSVQEAVHEPQNRSSEQTDLD